MVLDAALRPYDSVYGAMGVAVGGGEGRGE